MSNYLNQKETAAILEGGYAFQYWNGGVSHLYEGADAVAFIEQHYAPDNTTIASICFGNNSKIVDAYNAVQEGAAIFCEGFGIGDKVTYYDEVTEFRHDFDAFV